MMAWLWQFIAGYVRIKIEGLKLLQFVNEASAQGILLRATARQTYSRIEAEVSWRDYRRLLALARNRPLRVVAVTMGGVPYIGRLARKRLAFTAGMLCCIAALVVVNRFVLEIRVTGCTVPGLEEKAYGVLESQGLRPGAAKQALDLHRCERELMLALPEISFAAIRVSGVVATVSIVEGVPPPRLVDRSQPCDVVASRDAVVRRIIVYDGQVKVAEGDVVRRGQVLVEGTVALPEGFRRVHARADVTGGVWYEGRGSAPLFAEKKRKTGAAVTRSRLEFAGYVLPVGPQGPPDFTGYDAGEKVFYLLGEGLKGPRLVVTEYTEASAGLEETDFEQARRDALLGAVNEANAQLPAGADIADSRTVYSYEGGEIVARVYIETLENIALEQALQ